MSQMKLTYFNLKGRAELSRLILAEAGVDYEDCRLERDEWAQFKERSFAPFGQLPVLEVDGVVVAQSNSISRFLARR